MATWTKKEFGSTGVTEYPAGPALDQLERRFGGAVVLALDVSSSMSGHNLRQAVQGCRRFVREAVEADYAVGLVLWDHEVVDSVPVDAAPDAVLALLDRAATRGGTDVVPCLDHAHTMLMESPSGDMVVAVFGDGDLGNPHAARRKAAELVADGIRILTCGLGQSSAESLAAISTESSELRVAQATTIADSIAGMARGLRAVP